MGVYINICVKYLYILSSYYIFIAIPIYIYTPIYFLALSTEKVQH